MLANERSRYFEAPMPKEAFEFGMTNGNLLDGGRVVAPDGPGLGLNVDWDKLATADHYVYFELDLSTLPDRRIMASVMTLHTDTIQLLVVAPIRVS
jgi:hypothetical protein